MTNAAVAVDFYHVLDVERYIAAKVALDGVVCFDLITELRDLSLGQILCTGIRVDTGLCKDRLGTGLSDTVNVGQRDLITLRIWTINTSYTSQLCNPPFLWFLSLGQSWYNGICLALLLLMLGVLANNHYFTFSLDDFALFANLLYGRLNFHCLSSFHNGLFISRAR